MLRLLKAAWILFWVLMTQGLDVFIEPLPTFLREGN